MKKALSHSKRKAKRTRRFKRIAAALGCPLEFLQTLGAHWTEEQAREAWESHKAHRKAAWAPLGAEIGASIRQTVNRMGLMRRAADAMTPEQLDSYIQDIKFPSEPPTFHSDPAYLKSADYASLEARIMARGDSAPVGPGSPTGRLKSEPIFPMGNRPGVKTDPNTLPAFIEQMRAYQSMGARQPANTCSICGHKASTPQEFCEHLKGISQAYEGLEADPKFQATSESMRQAFMAGYLPGKPEMAKFLMLSQVVDPSAHPGTVTIMADGTIIAPEGVKVSVDPADEHGDFTVRAEYEYRCAEDPESGEPKLRSIGILKGIGEPPHE